MNRLSVSKTESRKFKKFDKTQKTKDNFHFEEILNLVCASKLVSDITSFLFVKKYRITKTTKC